MLRKGIADEKDQSFKAFQEIARHQQMSIEDITEGHTLIPRFRALNPRIHIIAMTGFNTRDLELEVRKQGVDQYLGKPVEQTTLKTSLDHMANRIGSTAARQNKQD